MRLILVETNEVINSIREIPEGVVTIGRKDTTIVPTVGVEAISRLHATITPISPGWLVEDGDGKNPSRNGIYGCSGERVDQQVLAKVGDYVDLLPPREGLLLRLIVEDRGRKEFDSSRETKGFEYVASDEFHQDVLEIKGEISMIRERVSLIDSEIADLRGEIIALKKVNEIQDGMIRRSRIVLVLFFAVLIAMLAAALGSEKHRSELIAASSSLVVAIATGYVVMVQKKTE